MKKERIAKKLNRHIKSNKNDINKANDNFKFLDNRLTELEKYSGKKQLERLLDGTNYLADEYSSLQEQIWSAKTKNDTLSSKIARLEFENKKLKQTNKTQNILIILCSILLLLNVILKIFL